MEIPTTGTKNIQGDWVLYEGAQKVTKPKIKKVVQKMRFSDIIKMIVSLLTKHMGEDTSWSNFLKKTGQTDEVEFVSPPKKPKARTIRTTKKGIYTKDSTGKVGPEPEAYSWSDMNYYP